ncbi:DUF3576 domain-containing protein [Oceaniglobus roseus]|uniref:DUF3576 domain-containing protein n=1 Tax=Oceaniglobus roseus TaxID=1737570 RepID=UPI000C7F5E8C|nr:DUF3576 domain-containing protein [Kandeliimicrobium roseum]
MSVIQGRRAWVVLSAVLAFSACGLLPQNDAKPTSGPQRDDGASIFDLFGNKDDPNTTIEVNKYIWNAAQQILDFMPIESADPFSGVLVYGYGRPPGGGRAYRATVYVQDPALDARSLNVALSTSSGPASPDTVRAIEDAILTRARQLRIRDGRL